MKTNLKVSCIVVFGVLLSFALPHIITLSTTKKFDEKKAVSSISHALGDSVVASSKKDSAVPVSNKEEAKEEIAEVVEEKIEEPKEKIVPVSPIVYDGLTLEQLTDKLNRSLKSNLSGTGGLFAKYAIDLGIDPYLAVAIVLLETGCNYSCSAAVVNKNNVGGMMGSNGLIVFESLDAGIAAFMNNLKTNYYDKGLTTAEAMNSKYASSTTWATRVNSYIEKIKAS